MTMNTMMNTSTATNIRARVRRIASAATTAASVHKEHLDLSDQALVAVLRILEPARAAVAYLAGTATSLLEGEPAHHQNVLEWLAPSAGGELRVRCRSFNDPEGAEPEVLEGRDAEEAVVAFLSGTDVVKWTERLLAHFDRELEMARVEHHKAEIEALRAIVELSKAGTP